MGVHGPRRQILTQPAATAACAHLPCSDIWSHRVGLERRGFSPDELKQFCAAYRLLQGSKLNTSDALAAIQERIASGDFGEHVGYLAELIAKSERGVIK